MTAFARNQENRTVTRRRWTRGFSFLSILILCLLLPVAYKFMQRAIEYPEYGTLVQWFNTSWLQMLVFWSLLLVLLHLLVIARRDVGELIRTIRTVSRKEER